MKGLNKQGPGKIDWTDYSINPISGCLHGCEYCYMLRMEKRFPGIMKPEFHPDRLATIKRIKGPAKVFVGSSGDMWGEWVQDCDINEVLEAISERPDITFQFLTKNPIGYYKWSFGKNCWLGTTIDGTRNTTGNIETLVNSVSASKNRFVSFEPLLAPVYLRPEQMKELDWIIIGADSTRGAKKPPREWADYLITTARNFNIPVWVKDNYGYPETIKEFPKTKGANHGCQKTENQK